MPSGVKSPRENSTSLRGQLYGLGKSSVLYQGTTLVGPYPHTGISPLRIDLGFSSEIGPTETPRSQKRDLGHPLKV